jgi:hypothetical protein
MSGHSSFLNVFSKMRHPVYLFEPVFLSIESKQEASGKGLQAQKLRLMQGHWRFTIKREFVEWMISQIETDIRLQETVQREVFLSEECLWAQVMAKAGLLTAEDKDRLLQRWQTELKGLNEAYWQHERQIYLLDLKHLVGPWTRAYFWTRRDPRWHLQPWLRWDCARRGGCCGRSCGCCERARSITRPRCFGHCTAACGCCQRTRGFEIKRDSEAYKLSKASVQALRQSLPEKRVGRKPNMYRSSKDPLLNAYVWGGLTDHNGLRYS